MLKRTCKILLLGLFWGGNALWASDQTDQIDCSEYTPISVEELESLSQKIMKKKTIFRKKINIKLKQHDIDGDEVQYMKGRCVQFLGLFLKDQKTQEAYEFDCYGHLSSKDQKPRAECGTKPVACRAESVPYLPYFLKYDATGVSHRITDRNDQLHPNLLGDLLVFDLELGE